MTRLEPMGARSNATILAASCIVGVALVMQFYRPSGGQAWIGVALWSALALAALDYTRTLFNLCK